MSLTDFPSLERFPRVPLLDGPTPIQRLHRLEAALGDALGGVQIFVKRDDHMSLGGGGNKLRKLEYLIGAAQAEGADTIVTVGGLQSNHARLTAAAAARAGLACELVLGRPVPRDDGDYERNGNVLLNGIFGATVHTLPPGENALAAAQMRAAQLRSQGRRVFLMPTGGSTPVGALGYMRCAQEIGAQAKAIGAEFAEIVVANGSAGTHAGLAAGLYAAGKPASTVRSFSTLADGEQARRTTLELTEATLRLVGIEASLGDADIQVDGRQRGAGYGIPTAQMRDALRMMARTQGLLLDPVYSGKAFAGLLADLRAGRYAAGRQVLFVMTGGTPGLYAYRSIFDAQ
ncbi:D-cysteine desulfhydrase family protein [Pantoea sp. 18069]|uniref:D-cysteine desulfhydrase family protein n=1 Tax=Pantoea sp. 18069 TaxID=2681415 RepID=UPI0013579107|nr:D-cysteine desulfhydrase family protein [Pantoea sp. 18069]